MQSKRRHVFKRIFREAYIHATIYYVIKILKLMEF